MRFCWLLVASMILIGANLLADDNEAVFVVELHAPDVAARTAIAQIIHIDSVFEDRVYSVVNVDDLAKLQKFLSSSILSVEILGTEISEYWLPLKGIIDFPSADEKFHTYDEMVSFLNKLAKDYPDMVKLFSIGQSTLGKDIWAIKIGENSGIQNQEKKAIAYMGTHHAREHVSTEIPLLFAEDVLKNYQTDLELSELLKSTDLYFIPMVNPDGAMHDIDGQRYRWWRKNRRNNGNSSYGVDLNRNYGFGWGTGGSSSSPSSDIYMGPKAFSEPETQSIRDFFTNNRNITMALSFHTFSELILYPWGGKSAGVGGADEALFKKMAKDMAAMNKYKPMQSSDLYIASGDTCDWLYGELSVFCFTFELSPSSMSSGGFYPGQAIIPQVYDDNREPMIYMARLAVNPRQRETW